MSRRAFQYEETREPAVRPDGRLYAEHLRVRVDTLRVGDVVTEVGTIMSIKPVSRGANYEVSGRLLVRTWPASKVVEVVRRNWE